MAEPFRTLIAAVRSTGAYVSVALWVFVFSPIGMVLALMFKWPGVLYLLGRGGVHLGFAAAGIRFKVRGTRWVQRTRGAVYCANHTSNLEPPIIFMALVETHPRLKVLYKGELRAAIPLLRNAFDMAGFVPIQRRNIEQSTRAIDQAAEAMKSGDSFLIFPEGTRSRTGELLPFKKGGFVMAIKAEAPIVPVAIYGARAAMRKGSPVIKPVTVFVEIGEPIETRGLDISDRNMLMQRTRRALESKLNLLRSTDKK